MAHPLVIIDAFTDRPFSGNPAGVCFLDSLQPDHWLQSVAAEVNLSETAFLLHEGEDYRLRWFTPNVEVDLCGHATLAAAHALWSEGKASSAASIRFRTRSGLLSAERVGEFIELDFPALPVRAIEPRTDLAEALGAPIRWQGTNGMDYFCELSDESAVRGLMPDFARLASIPTRGIIVTSQSSEGNSFDFVSRFFAPSVGIPEDPVTGSAHCALAPYWSNKLGKTELTGYQVSRRGGLVRTRIQGDRVRLGGQAVTVIRASLEA